MGKKTYHLWLIPVLVALSVRVVMYWEYWHSPLRYFHEVPGLDMETLLRFSQWIDGEFSPLFVVHRFLIFFVWLFNGKIHCVEAVVAIQAVIGIITVATITEIARICSGSRNIGMVTGIVYAIYGPTLLYEFVILQETVVIALFWLSFWAVLRYHSSGYRSWSGVATGVLLMLSLVGRPTAIFFVPVICLFIAWQLYRKHKLRNLRYVLGGIFLLYIIAMSFNLHFGKYSAVLFDVMPYVLEYNRSQTLKSEEFNSRGATASEHKTKKIHPYINAGLKALTQLPKLLVNYEIPENINYHAIANRITLLKILPGPRIIVFLGVLGLVALLFKPPFLGRAQLIFLPLALVALPLCAREAIGRYRLMLMPGIIFAAVWFIYQLIYDHSSRKYLLAAIISGTLICAIIYPQNKAMPLRSSDFVSWGWAKQAGFGMSEALEDFTAGWKLSGYRNQAAGVKTILLNLRLYRPLAALETVEQGLQAKAVNGDLFNYYGAIAHLMQGDYSSAKLRLKLVNPKNLGTHLEERFPKICIAAGLPLR